MNMLKWGAMHYHTQEDFITRSQKLKEIEELGVNPFPPHFSPTITPGALLQAFEGQGVGHSEEAMQGSTPVATIAGRLVLFRAMGKNAFAHLQDETGRLQVMFNRDVTQVVGFSPTIEMTALKFIEKKIDLGDILGVEGYLFRTQKGELTLLAKQVTLLCKSLLPLPDKHSGLVDKGVRYRKRWLDLITHPEVTQAFVTRSRILKSIRAYFDAQGFMEVETPVLQNIYGGAHARPFTTELHALNQEMYLRISLEIPLKKLIVGGLLKVFEMGKVFRNEGLDRTHNPEFTELEAYVAYADYNDMMQLTEQLFETLALELFGTTKLTFTREEGKEIHIDLKAPWKRLSMTQSLKTYASIDVDLLSDQEMQQRLLETEEVDPKEVKHATRGALIALLFETFVEEHLLEPHHIIDHPIETTPLCKLHRNPKLRAQGFVERFESFILGSEFCNSYTELNDPILQRELLEAQAAKRASGDEEAPPPR